MTRFPKFVAAICATTAMFATATPAFAGNSIWTLRTEASDGIDAETTASYLRALEEAEIRADEPAKPRLVVPASGTPGDAETVTPRGPVGVVVVERKLKELIEAAGARTRMDVQVSRGVRGVVRDAFLPADLTEMLDELSRTFNLVWYRKSRTIYVSTVEENATRLIFLGNTSFERFKRSLADADLADADFPIEYLRNAQSVSLTGPVSFLANAELIADALAKSGSSRSIMVIKGGAIDGSKG